MSRLKAVGLMLFASLSLTACTTSTQIAEVRAKPENPVIDANFPDPAAVKSLDGFTYVYATQGEVGGKMQNIQLARSRNLTQWDRLGDALPAACLPP